MELQMFSPYGAGNVGGCSLVVENDLTPAPLLKGEGFAVG